MKALVLSGGSIKGAFQAGAVEELLSRGFTPDMIYGVSVGAINGGFIADRAGRAGDDPEWPAIGVELVDFWTRNIRSFKDIGKERNDFGILLKVLRKHFRGLLKMGAITDLIRREIVAGNIARSPAKFHAGVVELTGGKYIDATAQEFGDAIIDYVIASTREPIIMPVVELGDGRVLVDGGVRNIAPLKGPIDAGAREIVVIVTQAEAPRPITKNFQVRDLGDLAKQTVGIMTNEIVNDDIKLATMINQACLEHGDPARDHVITGGALDGRRFVKLTVIRPDEPLDISITKFDATDIAAMIAKGKARAKAVLDAEAGGPPIA